MNKNVPGKEPQDKSKDIPEAIVKSQEEVAQIFGVSTRAVQFWVRDRMPVLRDGTYRISDIKAWLALKKDKKKKDKKGTDWDQEWRKQRALKELSLNQEREGKLLDRSKIEQSLIDLFTVVKTLLLSLPRGLSPQLQGLDARQIEVILTGRVKEIVQTISTEKIFSSPQGKDVKKLRKNKKAGNLD